MKTSGLQKKKKKKEIASLVKLLTLTGYTGGMSRNIYWGEETLPAAKLSASGVGSSGDRGFGSHHPHWEGISRAAAASEASVIP